MRDFRVRAFLKGYAEFLGHLLVILFGIVLIYIFIIIEMLGRYAAESNTVLLWVEQYMGIPIILLGIYLLTENIKRMRRKEI